MRATDAGRAEARKSERERKRRERTSVVLSEAGADALRVLEELVGAVGDTGSL